MSGLVAREFYGPGIQGSSVARATIRVGGDTVEGTTTSTTLGEILALTALSITAVTPIHAITNWRRGPTGSGDAQALYYIQINSTNIGRAFLTTSANYVADGYLHTILPASLTNYQKGGGTLANDGTQGTNFHVVVGDLARPTADVTDYDLLGRVATFGSGHTIGADQMHVYTMATGPGWAGGGAGF